MWVVSVGDAYLIWFFRDSRPFHVTLSGCDFRVKNYTTGISRLAQPFYFDILRKRWKKNDIFLALPTLRTVYMKKKKRITTKLRG